MSSTTNICRSATNRMSVSIVELAWLVRQFECARHRDGHEIGVGDLRQVDIPCAVAELLRHLGRHLQGRARVLPAPPAPVNVTNSARDEIAGTLDQSPPSRPTKLVKLAPEDRAYQRFWRPAAAGTRCADRHGTTAPPVRGVEPRAARGCPDRVSQDSGGSRSKTISSVAPDSTVWPPCARSRRRAVL